MVLKVFAWRYGGQRVSLCVSFNGWTERVPMIMVEGSSTVFQAVIDLPPGFHQFKFLVDGVWRIDDQQLCVQDGYGTINNIILVEESELISPTLPAEALQPSMHLNNISTMQQVASSSGSLLHRPVLHLADGEINISRQRLSMHLSLYTTYDLIPNSSQVFALDVKVSMNKALNIMHEQGLGVMPLWDDCSKQVLGMLTASDFILILIQLHRNRAILNDEQLQMYTISAWKEGKSQLQREAFGAALPLHRKPLIQAGPDELLRDMALRILQNKISSVPILHSAQDGSCQQLLHMACLAGLLRHICRYFRCRVEYLPLLQQLVGSLPLGTWTREFGSSNGCLLLTLHPRDSLSSALRLLIEAQISSIPIVDDNGTLINVYSRSDITSLARDSVYDHILIDQTIMSQALELVDGTPHNRYKTCTRYDSLYRVMELLSDPVVRRLIVTEVGSLHVEGIITLRDVFDFLLK